MRETLKKFVEIRPKKALAGCILAGIVISMVAMSGGSTKFLLGIAVLFLVQTPFRLRLEGRTGAVLTALWCVGASLAAVFIQAVANTDTIRISILPQAFLLEWVLYLGISLLVYAMVRRPVTAVTISLCIYLVLPIINAYTYYLRGMPLSPSDLLALNTAVNVSGTYVLFPLPAGVAYSLALTAMLFFSEFALPPHPATGGWKQRCGAILVSLVLLCGVVWINPNLEQQWGNLSVKLNGTHINMLEQLRQMRMAVPDGYDADALAEMIEGDPSGELPEELPTLLVIMDESYADLSVLGSPIQTNEEITPFLSGLRENTVSGYALASVFGGRTANSEWEFLTSSTMGCMPAGTVPYQQYVEENSYSILAPLKAWGYRCVATHPLLANGWNRLPVYEQMGFDETHFLEDYPQEDLIRQQVSDREMFREIIRYYENKSDAPLFLFGVTLQNHGGYSGSSDRVPTALSLEGYTQDYPETEQYLNLIRETDSAMEELIGYFEGKEDKVVILFFGDHQPNLGEVFSEEVHGGAFATPAERALQYQVPFYLWANYDISEETVPCTSLNYLPVYLLQAAGLPLPPYQKVLAKAMETIPAVNANVYYSLSAGTFLPIADAEGREAEVLETLYTLQYNAVFDKKGRDLTLFPYPEG